MRIYLWAPPRLLGEGRESGETSGEALREGASEGKRAFEYQHGRALLFHILGGESEILYSPHGKPYIEGAMHFSISHSQDLIGIALATASPCGFDIEDTTKKRNRTALLKRISHPSEKVRESEFFKLWVLKESYLKKTGMGLGSGLLKKIRFDVQADPWVPLDLLEDEVFYQFQFKNFECALCVSNQLEDAHPEIYEVFLKDGEFKTQRLNLAIKTLRRGNR